MNNHRTAANGTNLLRTVYGRFQTSGRCGWRSESGSAFENNMKMRMKEEAYYATPTARI